MPADGGWEDAICDESIDTERIHPKNAYVTFLNFFLSFSNTKSIVQQKTNNVQMKSKQWPVSCNISV